MREALNGGRRPQRSGEIYGIVHGEKLLLMLKCARGANIGPKAQNRRRRRHAGYVNEMLRA